MKLKRLQLRTAIVFTIFFTMMGSSVVFADSLNYSTSLKNMQDLGIIDSSVKDINSYVTRGQLVKSIVIAEGKSETAANLNGSTIFPDIDPASELSGYVNEGLNLGINEGINQSVITGRADGSFHGYDGLTYGEACTIMVRLLGYTDKDLTGSWPNNYIQKASNLNLCTGLNLKKSDRLTLGVEAVLFDRVFDSLMKKSSTSATDSFFSDNYYNDTTVTGKLVETVVLGNSSTSDNLGNTQILTDKGTYSLKRGARIPEIGGKYKLYVDGTTITKVTPKVNSLVYYAISSVSGSTITYTDDSIIPDAMLLPQVSAYTDDNKFSRTMVLPEASAYYYHGVSIDYDAAVKSIRAYSSIVIAKDSFGNNDYAVIVDPVYSKPYIYKYDSEKISELMSDNNYAYIYKNGYQYSHDYGVGYNSDDVVYMVSDLWGKNSFIYVNNSVINGKITAITPNKFSPSSVGISITSSNSTNVTQTVTAPSGAVTTTTTVTNSTSSSNSSSTYSFSEYFNRSKLNADNSNNLLNVGDYRSFILGIDGKILDVY